MEELAEKPPIGLIPNTIWIQERMAEIWLAINRFKASNREIPREWIAELQTHLSRMQCEVTVSVWKELRFDSMESFVYKS